MLEKPDLNDPVVSFLMKPRYICVGNYPNNPFQVSKQPFTETPEIIIPSDQYPDSYFKDSEGNVLYNCFRELAWYEFREEAELPKYIKLKNYPNTRDLPIVFRVVKPFPTEHPQIPMIGENYAHIEGGSKYDGLESVGENGKYRSTEIRLYLPATETEFLKDQKRCKNE